MSRFPRCGAVSLAFCALTACGGGASPEATARAFSAVGQVTLKPSLSPELTVDGHTGITIGAVNGTYGAGCHYVSGGANTLHSAGDPWSVSIGGYSGSVDYDGGVGGSASQAPLVVETNDSGCGLTLTSVTLADNDDTYSGSSTIALGTSYGGTPIRFNLNESTGASVSPTFYGNCKFVLDPSFGGTGAVLTCVLSDDAALVSASNTAVAVYTATGGVSTVAAPNDTVDLSGITVVVDSGHAVLAVSGNLALTHGATPGTGYAVCAAGSAGAILLAGATVPAADDKIITAYADCGGTTATVPTSIAGSSLITVSDTLSETAYVIVRNADSSSSVSSYELFALTFNHP